MTDMHKAPSFSG